MNGLKCWPANMHVEQHCPSFSDHFRLKSDDWQNLWSWSSHSNQILIRLLCSVSITIAMFNIGDDLESNCIMIKLSTVSGTFMCLAISIANEFVREVRWQTMQLTVRVDWQFSSNLKFRNRRNTLFNTIDLILGYSSWLWIRRGRTLKVHRSKKLMIYRRLLLFFQNIYSKLLFYIRL